MKRQNFLAMLLLLIGMVPNLMAGETEMGTGLEGVIVVSPTSAGPTMANAPSSTPLANVDLEVKKGDAIVASMKTDDQGRFRASLAPGHYTIFVKDGKRRIGRYGPFEVDIAPGHVKHVQWICDSGLR